MIIAVVLAGGRGERMQQEIPKQNLLLCGKPLLYHSIDTLEKSIVNSIVLVTMKGQMDFWHNEFTKVHRCRKISGYVEGGETRAESVLKGVKLAAFYADKTDTILVHDSARPLVTAEKIEEVARVAKETGGAVLGMPVKDTIHVVGTDGQICSTPERDGLYLAQTPQAFSLLTLKTAYCAWEKDGKVPVTDDAMVVRKYTGQGVTVVPGGYENIKVTTPEDLRIAEMLLQMRTEEKTNG